jgi:hypothetical protein
MLNVNADIHEDLQVKCPFLADFNPNWNVSTHFCGVSWRTYGKGTMNEF